MKILIVDDEILSIQYLEMQLNAASLPNYDMDIIPFTSSQEAMTYIRSNEIDIAFLDIMMPVINGLTLAKAIKKLQPNCILYILTAYKDFGYVKSSISIGIKDYLVKNELSSSMLSSILSSSYHEILLYNRKEILIKENIIQKIIKGSENTSDIKSFFLLKNKCYGVFLMYSFCGLLSEESIKFKPNINDICVSVSKYALLFITCITKELSISKNIKKIRNNAIDFMNTHNLISSSIFIGPLEAGNQFVESILTLYQFAEKYFLLTKDIILDYYSFHLDEESLKRNKLYETDEILQFLEQCRSSGLLLENLYQQSIKPIDYLSMLQSKLSEQTDTTEYRVEKICRYIKSNLNNDLSVSSIAKEFYLSPDYLRQLFKKEKKINLSDYVCDARLLRAQQMLLSTNFPVDNIAKSVGFSGTKYFSKLFKERYGLSPNLYRQQELNNEKKH